MSEEISREEIAALLARGSEGMTREEAIRCLSVHSSTNGSGLCTDKQHYEAKQIAIKALEQEPCEDAISRQAVHEAIEKWAGSMSVLIALPTREVRPLLDSIHDLPSVNSQEPKTDVLNKIRTEIEQAADKQFQIAMGVADSNERYTHIQMESAYRHSLYIIDKYKVESEGAE